MDGSREPSIFILVYRGFYKNSFSAFSVCSVVNAFLCVLGGSAVDVFIPGFLRVSWCPSFLCGQGILWLASCHPFVYSHRSPRVAKSSCDRNRIGWRCCGSSVPALATQSMMYRANSRDSMLSSRLTTSSNTAS